MSAMASQLIGLTIVYSIVYSGTDERKHQSPASLVTGEFPAQRASNAEKVSIWWRQYEWITVADMGSAILVYAL